MTKILVTGGAGYLGSHTCVELLNQDYRLVVVDNLLHSSFKSLTAIKEITGKDFTFYQADIRDKKSLEAIFEKEAITAVIHFAGLKIVNESTSIPLDYYANNFSGTITLLQVMQQFSCKNFIFSSSASVYGNKAPAPVSEEAPRSVMTPYGRTKMMIEDVLMDVSVSDSAWNIVILRYFNPIGAHSSGELGEDPQGLPTNLLPYISQVALGKLDRVRVFGGDYDTKDGTGIRDYIHVVDLARGHVAALQKLIAGSGLSIYNLGTGKGTSVLELIQEMGEIVGYPIPYQIVGRRAGDIAVSYADVSKAEKELNWHAQYDLKRMCQDSWRWQKKYPNGFRE
ncbi:UDP-glucose 4-epimerase GalE [Streptococcus mutans]|uniref:UDP-4-glucose epimerase PgfE n=1 Tax=Streptococcus mutans TaxID=1309 RepID=UPI001CFF3D05|nr:UDP-glucose 4-epimerase GalE [Streptococcus mutans]MCB4936182.1 UDP-glucose 4-epimerase GalE [Streptococcus mutans]MCB4987376.1 UDP-glucose 4-epimerase GalE [Streptococcus mutans]MDT9511472.1 UDP-glucose 4-epimerase GalE [Streptococcus mutans]MDT9530020.1 UDP-glucose 4-epimerase GalE [Streptococcus mutans]MDT9555853.1 UDP-glucose 4-epimerase GalE [Streptococcus mutans]